MSADEDHARATLVGAVALAAHNDSGGLKSKTDVLELLSRNPGLNLGELRATCAGLRLDGRLDAWLRDLARSRED